MDETNQSATTEMAKPNPTPQPSTSTEPASTAPSDPAGAGVVTRAEFEVLKNVAEELSRQISDMRAAMTALSDLRQFRARVEKHLGIYSAGQNDSDPVQVPRTRGE